MRLHVQAPEPEDDTVRMTAPAMAAPAKPAGASRPRPARAPEAPSSRDAPRKPAPSAQGGKRLLALGLAAGALLAGGFAWMIWPRPMPPAPPPLAVPAPASRNLPAPAAPPSPVAAPAPGFEIRTATRRQILADNPTHLAIFRYAPDPNILVLDFPSLDMQGLMLDRVAALIEKTHMPRNRVISWTHLRQVIAAGGDTIGTYYYGHDYSAAALARFFALAAADHRRLNPQEARLRALLGQLGWLAPGMQGGLITLPRLGANKYVTATARDVILTHELSHGAFFTTPAYRVWVRHFWRHDLAAAQRAGMRHFLGSEEYDTGDDTLMMNEMQAYLMFTRNPEFFQARDAGFTAAQRRALERRFLAGMGPGWLRNRLAALDAADRATVQMAPSADRRTSSLRSKPSHLQ